LWGKAHRFWYLPLPTARASFRFNLQLFFFGNLDAPRMAPLGRGGVNGLFIEMLELSRLAKYEDALRP
jgi:hypothetical protein